jgi:hypothetical protein
MRLSCVVRDAINNWSRWCWSGDDGVPRDLICGSIERGYLPPRGNVGDEDAHVRAMPIDYERAARVQRLWAALPPYECNCVVVAFVYYAGVLPTTREDRQREAIKRGLLWAHVERQSEVFALRVAREFA